MAKATNPRETLKALEEKRATVEREIATLDEQCKGLRDQIAGIRALEELTQADMLDERNLKLRLQRLEGEIEERREVVAAMSGEFDDAHSAVAALELSEAEAAVTASVTTIEKRVEEMAGELADLFERHRQRTQEWVTQFYRVNGRHPHAPPAGHIRNAIGGLSKPHENLEAGAQILEAVARTEKGRRTADLEFASRQASAQARASGMEGFHSGPRTGLDYVRGGMHFDAMGNRVGAPARPASPPVPPPHNNDYDPLPR